DPSQRETLERALAKAATMAGAGGQSKLGDY
ncbi:MAG: uracil-DNA glycosylase, partial [Actinobacteria bacterium]|nr:uracil-DNA glycosylase [Actinomycetota bacterium]NIU67398.1 uracil-DNA glycosylase [Actinomycetota bacterium]NIW29176.1 uracil-DNA glycosylase [Actinomycetota bacterium]NIX21707.1 uracil-DNA glycosylase [Actinomycetota bacterium]